MYQSVNGYGVMTACNFKWKERTSEKVWNNKIINTLSAKFNCVTETALILHRLGLKQVSENPTLRHNSPCHLIVNSVGKCKD